MVSDAKQLMQLEDALLEKKFSRISFYKIGVEGPHTCRDECIEKKGHRYEVLR